MFRGKKGEGDLDIQSRKFGTNDEYILKKSLTIIKHISLSNMFITLVCPKILNYFNKILVFFREFKKKPSLIVPLTIPDYLFTRTTTK